MPIELGEMQAKIKELKAKANETSGIPEAEMHRKAEELKKQHKHWVLSRSPSEQSNGSLSHHHMRAQTALQWHFTIDVDWVPGSEVGLESLLDFCDRWKLKATIFVAGRSALSHRSASGQSPRSS